MPRASTNCENNAVNGMILGAGGSYTGTPAYFGLNSADPGTSGGSEISGGSPAYARVGITWGSIASGQVANTNTLTLNVPASTTVPYFSTWGAASGTGSGGAQIGGALSSSITFNSQGTLTVAAAGATLAAS